MVRFKELTQFTLQLSTTDLHSSMVRFKVGDPIGEGV